MQSRADAAATARSILIATAGLLFVFFVFLSQKVLLSIGLVFFGESDVMHTLALTLMILLLIVPCIGR